MEFEGSGNVRITTFLTLIGRKIVQNFLLFHCQKIKDEQEE